MKAVPSLSCCMHIAWRGSGVGSGMAQCRAQRGGWPGRLLERARGGRDRGGTPPVVTRGVGACAASGEVLRLDWVATFPWSTWQASRGLGGRNPVHGHFV
jgi:hypothetical protein